MNLRGLNLKSFSFLYFLVIFIFGTSSAQAQFIFTKDLFTGSSSPDVLELQKFLNSDSRTKVSETGPGSPGLESSYFGLKTKDAVMRFQALYRDEILSPSGLLSPTGYVGKATRTKLNALTQTQVWTAINVGEVKTTATNSDLVKTSLSVSSFSPSVFIDGETLQIVGTGFENKNTLSLNLAGGEEFSVTSADGKNISAKISTKMGEEIRKVLNDVKSKSPDDAYPLLLTAMKKNFFSDSKDGIYADTFFVIKNSRGQSDQMPISIKIFSN